MFDGVLALYVLMTVALFVEISEKAVVLQK